MSERVQDWETVAGAFVEGRAASADDLRVARFSDWHTDALLWDEQPVAARLDGFKRLVFVPEGVHDPAGRTLREIIWYAAESRGFRVVMNNPLLDQIADYPRGPPDAAWYERLRERWRPERVRVLLIGESAPDPRDGSARFFYAEPLTQADNLYRAVVVALLKQAPGHAGDPKHDRLRELRARGIFLIDLCREPVNRLSAADRRAALRASVPACVELVRRLDPEGVIVCHKPTFTLLQKELGALLLHAEALPFPLGNHRAAFVDGARRAFRRSRAGSPWSD